MMSTENLIIGAGPAGLAVAGRLSKMGIPFQLIEQSDKIANSWQNHYHRLHLHTAKSLSNLPHKPFPEDYPTFVPRQKLVDYYEAYAEEFDIKPLFGQEVEKIERRDNKWRITTTMGNQLEADRVVVGTGVNRIPHRPNWPGEEKFEGEILHSRAYRTGSSYKDKRVLVIGMGNTGAEIALDLHEQGAKPTISVRSPINIVPLNFLGRPTQLTALKLDKLPKWFGDWMGTFVQWLTVGNLKSYGIQSSSVPPAKQLRVQGRTPIIDLGTVKEIKSGNIQILSDIKEITAKGVVSEDGQEHEFDAIVLCTGYRANLDEMIPGFEQSGNELDPYGLPKKAIGEEGLDGLYFLGYDNYRPGGILGIIHKDSELIASDIAAKRN